MVALQTSIADYHSECEFEWLALNSASYLLTAKDLPRRDIGAREASHVRIYNVSIELNITYVTA